ncbi:MAG: M56 family metallopeptidase [Lachnospiraceae bacterium]|nr:M56 family metallopeptidase [Lachnospiraceae bacterium]
MLHFRMNMPFALMALYGSLMIIIVLLFRALLKDKLPKFVFPILWCVILVRLLVPFSLSSPLSLKVPEELLEPLVESSDFIRDLIQGTIANTASSETIALVAVDELLPAGDIAQPQEEPESSYNEVLFSNTVQNIATTTNNNTVVSEDAFSSYANSTYIYQGASASRLNIRPVTLAAIYFLGLLVTIGILLFQKYSYTMKLKNRLLIEHNETINDILREMGMGHILVFTNDEIASPLVYGLFTPRIYLPTRMDFQNTELLRHILTHEVMHIKHKDNWIKIFMFIALCLNWFNPLVWLMSKYLASDLESYCDETVLKQYNDEESRKSYAFSLLSMAITGNRTTLLYSAFSKTEVEKRIKNILNYKKTPVILLMAAVIFMLSSTVVFATGVQAPFSSRLTPYCSSDSSRWGVTVNITRDISLGKNSQRRAENIVFDTLRADTSDDPELIESQLIEALANEFRVEKSAFKIDLSLCLSDEEREKEYATWKLSKDKQGYFLYNGDPVRTYIDEIGGYYQSREEGVVDITIQRDRYGNISEVIALHEGDSDFDRRTRDIATW